MTNDATDTAVDAAKHYELVECPNSHLEGKKHLKTGIEFERKQIKYSDGKMIEGVFAKFPSKVDIQLPKDLYKNRKTTAKGNKS